MTKVWWNGELQDDDRFLIDPRDRGFLLGDGLFETVAVKQGCPRWLERHCARFRQGCEILGMDYPSWDIMSAINQLLEVLPEKNIGLRLTLTRGVGGRGIGVRQHASSRATPSFLISSFSLPTDFSPLRCLVSTITRRNEHSPLSRIKSLNYLDSILARREADEEGYEDAVLLNSEGAVAEATTSNIFAVFGDVVLTPPIHDGALPGICRGEVINLLKATEATLFPERLRTADEVFLTNSLGVRGVVALGDVPIGTGAEGVVTRKMRRELN